MTRTVRTRYTLECKKVVVQLVAGGQSIAAAARMLGVGWSRRCLTGSRRDRQGKLKGADSKVVSANQMEISQIHSTLAYVKQMKFEHDRHAAQASQFVTRLGVRIPGAMSLPLTGDEMQRHSIEAKGRGRETAC